ncbi:transcription-repair-coupling factor [Tepiditoga spiralis]|uniref:Transcription-repair-coupling factor n=1 Tax=Tepiditoga spiralis TaxID=2108365 RepID=A0A7G1G7X6_9BACT|nr:DEAD/DEAH box helicase [Tepiditoga spiralis]BBE31314.1 transcription-repair-coupling factor [Tepiditoga spiralis]
MFNIKNLINKIDKNKNNVIIIPEYSKFEVEDEVLYYPDSDIFPFEEFDISSEIKSKRLKTLYELKNKKNNIIITTLHAITRYTIPLKHYYIKRIENNFEDILYELGYTYKNEVREFGEYSKRGFIRDIFLPISNNPIRIELFDNDIERINLFDSFTQKSIKNVSYFDLIPGSEVYRFKENIELVENRINRIQKNLKTDDEVSIEALYSIPGIFHKDKNTLFSYLENNTDFYLINKKDILKSFSEKEKENIEVCDTNLKKAIYKEFSGISIDFLKDLKYKEYKVNFKNNVILKKEKVKYDMEEIPLIDWEDLKENDYVVHSDYGIGLYKGIKTKETILGIREYIIVEYSNSSRVFVPVERLDKLSKFIGDTSKIKISNLSGKRWQSKKKKVEKNIREKLNELKEIYAKRENSKGISLIGDKELEEKFVNTFSHIETADQIRSINEVKKDLESLKPMDRLLVGDAGFGKTEIAMRAAFKAVVSNYQTLLLAPTTILAKQHYQTFKERMDPFGVNIELITRYKTISEKENLYKKIKNGNVDIIIGTHSLFSKKIDVKNLGLVIIDEEQKFGVLQKEKFKKIQIGVNILMMSATPIPRTMYKSMSGLQEISTISTPPFGRIPIQTYVGLYSKKIVRKALLREKSRSGQSIFIHNRVQDIENIYSELKSIVPELKVKYVHGRMKKSKFIDIINDFYSNKIDVLLATTIIENGIDVPNANTLIVDDSFRYGISQLYQIKGRVGRTNKRAFAYFMYRNQLLNEDSKKRLESIKRFNEPGSGLKLALRDLEIRGYGDLLGLEQKGHINTIGLHLYKNILEKIMLEEKVTDDEKINLEFTDIIGIKGNMIIPENYINNSIERMRIYRRISICKSENEVISIKNEIEDRFGRLPKEIKTLFDYAIVRVKATKLKIEKIEIGNGYILFKYNKGAIPKIENFLKHSKSKFHSKTNEIICYGTDDEIKFLNKVLR